MKASEVVAELTAQGVILSGFGDRLVVDAPVGVVTQRMRQELRSKKPEIIRLLDEGWPKQCLEAERRFCQPHARLFPLLGRAVDTPMGYGTLVQVFARSNGTSVALESERDRVAFFDWQDIRPLPRGDRPRRDAC